MIVEIHHSTSFCHDFKCGVALVIIKKKKKVAVVQSSTHKLDPPHVS